MKKTNHLLLCAIFTCTIITAEEAETPKIFDEIRRGDKEAIKKRLEGWQDCSQTDENGNNGLHVAVEEGQTEIVVMLTTETDLSNWDWNYLCSWVQSTAKLPDKNKKNKNGDRPLHRAIETDHFSEAQRLIDKGANVHMVNNAGLPASFITIEKDDAEHLSFWEKNGLIKQQNSNGDSLLNYAIKKDKRRAAELLADNKSLIALKNNQGKTPAMVATEVPGVYFLELLQRKKVDLNAAGNHGFRPIHNAAMHGNCHATEFLLKNGVFVDTVDDNGITPLHYSIAENKPQTMHLLLANKADIKRRDKYGNNGFAFATYNKHYNLIEELKKHPDVDMDDRDKLGRTAFMRETIAGNHETMRYLIECGVNIRLGDNALNNSLHEAARNGNIESAQIILKADKNTLTDTNKNGDNPLFTAIHSGNFAVAGLFTSNGALLVNKDGNTPAHTAAISGTVDALRNCMRYDSNMIFKRNTNNYTPFLLAAESGNVETADFLLHDNDYRSKDIGIAINLAEKNGHHKMAKLLRTRDNQQMDKCIKISNQPLESDNIEAYIGELHVKLILNDSSHFFSAKRQPKQLKRYSPTELYYKTEAERAQISLEYTQELNAALQEKMKLENKLNIILENERQEKIKLEKERERTELERLKKQKEANDRLRAEQAEHKFINEQHAEINHYNQQKKANDEKVVAEQQAVLDHCAAAKAAAEHATRQQQHNNALDKQQPHVQIDLKPSAPPMDESDNECCFCYVEQDVTPIPSDCCKVGTARICKTCLKSRIESNEKNNLTDCCPYCNAKNKLDKKMLEEILKQK